MMCGRLVLVLVVLFTAAPLTHSANIYVRNDGSNSPNCLNGTISCRSLDYAIAGVQPGASDVEIVVHDSHEINSSAWLEHVDGVSIIGKQSVEIRCTVLGAGVGILNSMSIVVANVSWTNCALLHNTTARLEPAASGDAAAEFEYNAYSAIFAYNCTDLLITGCKFTSSRGSGISLYDITGDVFIRQSHFQSHSVADDLQCHGRLERNNSCSPQSTGLYIEGTFCGDFTVCNETTVHIFTDAVYMISECTFTDNVNIGNSDKVYTPTPDYLLRFRDHWPFGGGGGMVIAMHSMEMYNVTFNIVDTRFVNNTAQYGGGMQVHYRVFLFDLTWLNVERCVFTGNTALFNGGGLGLHSYIYYSQDDNVSLNNTLTLTNTNFTNNTAKWGGGIAFAAPFTTVDYLTFLMNGCIWIGNTFQVGAAAIGIMRIDDQYQRGICEPYVLITNGFFSGNKAILKPHNESLKHVSGVVYTEGISMHFHGNTQFLSNVAAALCVSNAGANFSDHVIFRRNVGYNGGAMYMTGISWLGLTAGVQVEFANNTAFESGGALYYQFPAPIAMDTAKWCFIRYSDPEKDKHLHLWNWNVSVTFHDNSALNAGDDVYISNAEGCDWPNDNITIFPISNDKPSVFKFGCNDTDNVHMIATMPHNMTFEGDVSLNDQNFHQITIRPGEYFNLKVMVYDRLNQTVNTFLSVKCNFVSDYQQQNLHDDICLKGSGYSFGIENEIRMVPSGLVLKNFRLTGPQILKGKEFVLIFTTVESAAVTLPLVINFTACSPGYVYIDNMCQCHDVDGDGNFFICMQIGLNPVPCLLKNFWYGSIFVDNETNTSTIPVYHRCLPGRCSTDDLQNCSTSVLYYSINGSNLCPHNLTGPLCSTCPPNSNLSLSYNAYSCYKCDAGEKAGLVFLILFECVFVVGVVVLFLKLNVKVSTASVYGLIYFYSVLPFFLPGNLPDSIEATILFFVDLTSLEFDLLKLTRFCLFDTASAIHYEALHFIYPVVVIFLVLLLIKLDQYCLRRFTFFTGYAAVQALCILLLMAYTALSVTSLKIVLPLTYLNATPMESGMKLPSYVFADPNTHYFDPVLHIPYWILAMLILCLLVLPYAVLLIAAPWIMTRVSLTRIKPILDEYQNCFCDNCRWFAGVYLLARPILFVATALAETPAVTSYLQQLICVALLVLVTTIQPYQKRLYNYIDIALLTNLTIISFTARASTVQQTFVSVPVLQIVLVSVLSLAPFILMLLAFILVAVYQWCQRRRHRKAMQSVLLRSQSPNTGLLESRDSDSNEELLTSTDDDLPERFYEEERAHRRKCLPINTAQDEHGIQQFWRRFTSRTNRQHHYQRLPTAEPINKPGSFHTT